MRRLLPVLLALFLCTAACTGGPADPLPEQPASSRAEEASAPAPCEPAGPLGPLRVREGVLADESGTPFAIRGVNITGMWYALFEDGESVGAFYDVLLTYQVNTVRICLDAADFAEDAAASFARLERTVAAAAERGLYSIVHMRAPPGGLNGYQNPDEEPLFESRVQQERFLALWAEIARCFAGNPAVLGYSLLHEPLIPLLAGEEAAMEGYAALLQRAADGIRASDREHVLILERPAGYYTIPSGGQEEESGAEGEREAFPEEAEGAGGEGEPEAGEGAGIPGAEGWEITRRTLGFPDIEDPAGNVLLDAHLMMRPGLPYDNMDFHLGVDADTVTSSRYIWYDDWAGYAYTAINHGRWHTATARLRLKEGDAGSLRVFLYFEDLDPEAVVYADNLTLEKRTPQGGGTVFTVDFNDLSQVNAYGLNTARIQDNPWRPGDKLWMFRNLETSGGLLMEFMPSFVVRPDESWVIALDLRVEGPRAPLEQIRYKAGLAEYRSDAPGGPEFRHFDRNYLQEQVLQAVEEAEAQGSPLYFGELGVYYGSLGEYGNSGAWAEDAAELLGRDRGFAWYSAAGSTTGLWRSSQKMDPELTRLFELFFAPG